MKNKLIILILIPFLISCAKEIKWEPYIDPDFKTEVDEFSEMYDQPMPTLRIVYVGPMEKIAICSQTEMARTITVDRDRWNALCPEQKRGIMFHELGHCVLQLEHSPDMVNYMFWSLRPCTFYQYFDDQMDVVMFGTPI